MAEIVREAKRFRQVLVEPQRPSHGAADLRDFDAVGQANTEMVAVGRDEHLRLMAQAAERDRVDDAVAVALKCIARTAGPSVALRVETTARLRRLRRNR